MTRHELAACLLDEAGRHHQHGRHERALRCEGAAAAVEAAPGTAPPDDALPAWLEGWEAGADLLSRIDQRKRPSR